MNKNNLKTNEQGFKNKSLINDRLSFATKSDINDLFAELNTDIDGLEDEQIELNRSEFGNNKVTDKKKEPLSKKIYNAFINPFTVILILLAVVSFITDVIMPIKVNDTESIKPITVIIIIIMIIISGLLRFVQEIRSGNAADKLLSMITTTTNVTRKSVKMREIPIEEVVVGDIIRLAAGDMVPADVRIIRAKDLFVSQSAITGEGEPVEKIAGSQLDVLSFISCSNLAFMGTNVVSGSALCVAVLTGDDTMFGSVASSINSIPVETSFEKGVNSVSWVLIRFMLVMVLIVFFINGITKGDWMQAFLFGISVAVGLTPEMLPMIITTCLAKGAVAMSRKKTIVKNLNSIQNFGAMDILCTDKTGTLTQDKVALQYHMDVHGEQDLRVLRYAFLNSYFQTGLKNLMDISIITRTQEKSAEEEQLHDLHKSYEKVDEIPFDFNRRRMSVVVVNSSGKRQMLTKGAVEEIISICSFVEYNGRVEELTDELKDEILKTVEELNDSGMRVIAVAKKNNPSPVGAFSVKDENEMVLVGYLTFLDPPKETVTEAIRALTEHGVSTKILTGDNDKVTKCICRQVGLKVDNIALGSDIENLTDDELKEVSEITNVFAKLSPEQKARIVTVLRNNGHTVGFMGDGINDAAAMKAADIGISVDTAVDISKESADIILLKKDLTVLEEGLFEGRKTYANMIKYIKMTASSNFGNMFSVVTASALLPFLPMLSIHIIILNLIYDVSCIAIPWDNVDKEFLKTPRKWDASSIGKFMIWIGPTSSIFDITTYLIMYFIICPQFISNGVLFHHIPVTDVSTRNMYTAMFQTGWLIESMWSQSLIIHMIRTKKTPFIQSRASFPVVTLTFMGIALLTAIPFTEFGFSIGLYPLPIQYFYWLALTIVLYMGLTTILKNMYVKRYGELL